MNKSNKNNVWGAEEYETPTIATLNIQSEGLLCVSFTQGGGGIFEDGDINDNGEY